MSKKVTTTSTEKWWLDNPANVKLIISALVVVCVALFLADFFYHKHGHFAFEQWPGFYAWYGFLSYCAIVLTAKQIRKVIGRKEAYYESEESDLNNEPDNQPGSAPNANGKTLSQDAASHD